MKRINQYVTTLMIFISVSMAAQAKDIVVTSAGTLSSLLSMEETQTITELTISGPLNGTDIALIRATAGNLERLNLTNAAIVAGGNPYYTYNGTAYSTQSNIVGSYMFNGMVNLIDLKLPKNTIGIGSWGYSYGGNSISNCPSLETATLPTSGLLWIGELSFKECTRLKEIIIPEGVKLIGTNAFEGCRILKKVSLPSTLVATYKYDKYTYTAGGSCFSSCASLSEVILPEGLSLLYSYMFNGASSMVQITLPSTLKVINSAFTSCSGLTALQLPTGLTQLGSMYKCSSLQSLDIPEGVTEVGSFYGCTKLETVHLPQVLTNTTLPDFRDCSSLKSIAIPDNITSIPRGNFQGCTSLSTVTFSPSSKLETIDRDAFRRTPITEIHLPETVKNLEEYAFYDCKQLKHVTLPKNSTEFFMQNFVFTNCSALEEINLPASLRIIPQDAFSGCSSLKEITLPGALTGLGYSAFKGCTQLTEITIPGTITTFNSYVFAETGITKVTLKNGIREVGPYAFFQCPVTSIIFPKTIVSISGLGGSNITTIGFAEGAAPIAIADDAFNSCKITSCTIPETVTSIGNDAFARSSIEEIIIPKTVTSIGERCFSECAALTKVILPDNMIQIPAYMFSHCLKLETIQLPATIEVISHGAFNGSSIHNIQLPESLKTIESYAFSECKKLNSIILPPYLETIGSSAFRSAALSVIEIPSSVTKVEDQAFHCRPQTSEVGYSQMNTVVWNPEIEVPYGVFTYATYLYIPENGSVNSDAKNNFRYIFRGGVTDQITIQTNTGQFSIAKELKAKSVCYFKNFNTESGYNSAAGWKTIVLPFDVDKFTYTYYSTEPEATGTPLAPFGDPLLNTDETALPFWLYELTATGYAPTTTMKANKPYLICMPNNQAYPPANNISGNVRFSAQNESGVLLVATEGALQPVEGNQFDLIPTYQTVPQSEQVYALNETRNFNNGDKNYPAGSVFIRNYTDIEPFQAYIQTKATPASAPMFYSIDGGEGGITGIGSMILTPDKAVKAYSKNGILYIESNAPRTVHIYDANGRTVRVVEVREGSNELPGLADGIYFLEGQKVMVKK